MQVRFVSVASKDREQSTELRLPVVLGRSEKDAKLRIRSDSVSRKHCEFFLEDDVVFVRDLGSTNGTFVDGTRVSGTTPASVRHGGIVRVGTVSLRVEWESLPDRKSTDRNNADDDTAAIAAKTPDTIRDETPEEPELLDDAAEPVAVADDAGEAEAGFPAAADEVQPPPDDEKLGDFFKSLK